MLIEGTDYFIRYRIMLPGIHAFVMPNNDGTFSVYLDPRRDFYHRQKDLQHELDHILNNDFYSELPIQEIEKLG